MGSVFKGFDIKSALDPLHIGIARQNRNHTASHNGAVTATPQAQPTMDDASVQAALDEQQRKRLLASQTQKRMGTALSDSTTTDQLG